MKVAFLNAPSCFSGRESSLEPAASWKNRAVACIGGLHEITNEITNQLAKLLNAFLPFTSLPHLFPSVSIALSVLPLLSAKGGGHHEKTPTPAPFAKLQADPGIPSSSLRHPSRFPDSGRSSSVPACREGAAAGI